MPDIEARLDIDGVTIQWNEQWIVLDCDGEHIVLPRSALPRIARAVEIDRTIDIEIDGATLTFSHRDGRTWMFEFSDEWATLIDATKFGEVFGRALTKLKDVES